jgi:MFS transporter, MHS family, proline/betaine transporter
MAVTDAIDENAPTAVREISSRGAVVVAAIGNTLGWYDSAAYGFFAITISKLFVSASDETGSLLLSVATFGVGFVMRRLVP